METNESQAASTANAASQPTKTSTIRLVIRARVIPEAPPQPTAPERLNRRALALVVGVVAVLTLTWVGVTMFRSALDEAPRKMASRSPAPAPTQNETPPPVVTDAPPPKLATSTAETEPTGARSVAPGSTKTTSAASDVPKEQDASPSPINEVIPDVPQSALQTIRGTVRVSIRVIVDKEGTVLAGTSDDPGPSRYFERLALESAKKWTFTPADTQEQRITLLQFNFTREGTTARATPPQ